MSFVGLAVPMQRLPLFYLENKMTIVILCKCIHCGAYVDQPADGDTEDMIQWHLERIARDVVDVKQSHVCSRGITIDVRGALKAIGVRVFK